MHINELFRKKNPGYYWQSLLTSREVKLQVMAIVKIEWR